MSQHILIIADGRSPTTHSWIENVQSLGYQVSLVSTFPCDPLESLHDFFVLPIAFSRFSTPSNPKSESSLLEVQQEPKRTFIRRFAPYFQSLRYIIGPLTLPWFVSSYQHIVKQLAPDLVHALRIPFEGMLGSYTPQGFPFIATTWGNDLTLHAGESLLMQAFTKRCLGRANGFTADTHRDVRLAYEWGLSTYVPTLVVPGSGGLDLATIQAAELFDEAQYNLPSNCDWVVNPRGMRPGSVHQDVFFAAIPEVLQLRPQTCFICPGLEGSEQAQHWITQYGIQSQTHLLPKLNQPVLWALLKRAQVFVSPSSHDGTPNSLLEAMACGCFPVAGDIESIREWIEPGVNGLLVTPHNPKELAEAICQALDDNRLRKKAVNINYQVVLERAAKAATSPEINAFYQRFMT